MKSQSLFSGKNKKYILKYCLLSFFSPESRSAKHEGVFGDNFGIIFVISQWKHIHVLWYS